jgi:hypothetical protein
MSLNWLGAFMNFFWILFTSSITAMKSLTLKPKLILKLSTALFSVHEKVGWEIGEQEKAENKRTLLWWLRRRVVCTQPHEAELRGRLLLDALSNRVRHSLDSNNSLVIHVYHWQNKRGPDLTRAVISAYTEPLLKTANLCKDWVRKVGLVTGMLLGSHDYGL